MTEKRLPTAAWRVSRVSCLLLIRSSETIDLKGLEQEQS